jgi:MOSC domain-containing protein YiiM
MFGENLTVEGLDETKLFIGDVFKIGTATIRITEPRQPCYKFGYKMGDQRIIRKFINTPFSGSYVAVKHQGDVKMGDEPVLINSTDNQLSVAEVFHLIYSKSDDKKLKDKVLREEQLHSVLKQRLLKNFTI